MIRHLHVLLLAPRKRAAWVREVFAYSKAPVWHIWPRAGRDAGDALCSVTRRGESGSIADNDAARPRSGIFPRTGVPVAMKGSMAVVFPEETKVARAARRFCLDCQGAQPSLVRACEEANCPLHPWRLPDSAPTQEAFGRVVRAVRRHCLVCAGDKKEVRTCDAKESCPLWDYRFGVQPVTYKRVSIRVRAPKTLFLPGFEEKN